MIFIYLRNNNNKKKERENSCLVSLMASKNFSKNRWAIIFILVFFCKIWIELCEEFIIIKNL